MNLKFQNKNISYTKAGNGKTIIFLHGFTENKEMWRDFTKVFSDKFQVIAIDLPGHGESDNFSEVHTMEFMAETVKFILDNEGIEKGVLVGHSMGGYMSLAFADLFPKMIEGLVLFHSSATADTEEVKQNRDRLIKIVQENKKSFINSFIPSLFSPENKELFKEKINGIIETSNQTSVEGITAALEGMKLRTEKLSLIQKADFPVLFIAGKEDSRIPIEKILPQIALPKKAYALLLDNVGHMGFIEAKEETINMILSFASYL